MLRYKARHGTRFIADADYIDTASVVRIINEKGEKLNVDPDDLMEFLTVLHRQELARTYEKMTREELLSVVKTMANL